jgi:hypothetical protein
MPTARKWCPIYLLTSTLALVSSISCTSSSPVDPSERVANLQVTVTPNPIVQNGTGACVTSTGSTPGIFRLFPHSITLDETSGVGVTIQSYRITALSGGQITATDDNGNAITGDGTVNLTAVP